MSKPSTRLAVAAIVAIALAAAVIFSVSVTASTQKTESSKAIAGLRVLEPVAYENLIVFPVVAGSQFDASGYATLDEALAAGAAVVTERGSEIMIRDRGGRRIARPQSSGASVNELVLVNRGSKPLLLLAGEVITGGKQDRVIAKDRIVAPGADPLPLEVFCVERGRWSGGAVQEFKASALMVHPSVREKANVDRDQSQVWAANRSGSTSDMTRSRNSTVGGVSAGVPAAPPPAPPRISADTINSTVAVEAQSESYAKLYGSRRVQSSVESFAEEIERRFAQATKGERVVGVVIAYNGEVAWSDTFASTALFERYWSKLLRSYIVEALARPRGAEKATIDDARDFLTPLNGRETIESEPGIYRWREISRGRYAQIELEALGHGKSFTVHRVTIHRTS